jgi:CIC family chloride channel protein
VDLTRSSGRWRLPRLTRFDDVRRRSQQVLLLAGTTGAIVGVVVAAFDWVTSDGLFDAVLDLPLAAIAAAPLVGLLVAAAALRWLAQGATPATADEYIRSFHDPSRPLDTRPVLGRMVAAVATLGAGGAMGYEGPAIYAGAATGSWLQRRFGRWFSTEDAKVLLVAGAAAGVAAIFKAPVTGLVFALEVPYHDDLARRMLLPAAIAAATSYVTFVAFIGTEPLLPIAGHSEIKLAELAGAAAVGLAAGMFARLFAVVMARAKQVVAMGHPWRRAIGAGGLLGGLFLAGRGLAGTNLALGPGYDALRWALEPERSVPMVLALATLRVAATATTVAGGGVGGLFIPLVLQGAFVGRVASGLFSPANPSLFPVVGIAAFLGAGYGVPLAAVVFVAEFTGRPGFVVPGLIAAVVAQLVMGRTSVSPYQATRRAGHLEHRLTLPVADVVDTEVRTVPPDATIDELFWQHLVGTRQRAAVVVDGDVYVGVIGIDQLAGIERGAWPETRVADHLLADLPVVRPTWSVSQAMAAMDGADVDRLAVVEGGGRFVGVVTKEDVVRLDEILDATRPPPGSLA